jgi:hypothetical protein
LIDRIGTSAGDEGDLSAPGMVLQLDGKDLPVAGDAFTPVVDIARLAANPIVENDGYRGTASVKAHTYGFKLTPTGSANEPSFAAAPTP